MTSITLSIELNNKISEKSLKSKKKKKDLQFIMNQYEKLVPN